LADFMTDRPHRRLGFKKALLWLLFPVAYAIYALVRGGLTGWYPYPFLNPDVSGAESVVVTILSLFALGLVLIWGVDKLSSNQKSR